MKKLDSYGVAPWKLDSPVERFLGKKADRSEFWKRLYVDFYKTFDGEYYRKGLPMIEKTIQRFRPDAASMTEKEKQACARDMIYSLHRFGCMFDEYFLFRYADLTPEAKDSYITDKNRHYYFRKMNAPENNAIFDDKSKAYEVFKKYYHRDQVLVKTEADREAFLAFVEKHPAFFAKPCRGSGGLGAQKLSVTPQTAETCFRELIGNKYGTVCEEPIVQTEDVASMHPASVNTVRIITIRTKHKIHIWEPIFRAGKGGSVVDNALIGGVFAPIDAETGIVCGPGRDESGNEYMTHPDTGVVFPGYRPPDWEQAVALAKELSGVIPDTHWVGWDLAHTDKGWIMIEGNSHAQAITQQLLAGVGFKYQIEEMIRDMD